MAYQEPDLLTWGSCPGVFCGGWKNWLNVSGLARRRKVMYSPNRNPTRPTTTACLGAYRGKPALPEKCWDPWR